MNRITEFHNIMPISNIGSVLQHGLLSHQQATGLFHSDVSMTEVQDRRDLKVVPNGLPLHQYANVYFHARNPMMYSRSHLANDLCVLIVSRNILNIPGVVVADQNASSRFVLFMSPQEMNIYNLDLDLIFSESWLHNDQIEEWRHKSRKCAEVLVPNCISLDYIQGAYVVSDVAGQLLQQQGFTKPITVNPHLFFR